jgi:hypothetical protein
MATMMVAIVSTVVAAVVVLTSRQELLVQADLVYLAEQDQLAQLVE